MVDLKIQFCSWFKFMQPIAIFKIKLKSIFAGQY